MVLTRLLIIISSLLLLASCADYNNDIYINEDGSGKVSMSYDASEMMGMIEMMKSIEGMEENDSDSNDNDQEEPSMGDGEDVIDEDSKEDSKDDLIGGFMSSMTSADGPSLEMDMDTTINFYNEMPDSIKNKLSKPELLKKVNFSILSNKAQGKMVMGMDLSYDSMEELGEMYSEMSKLNDGDDDMGKTLDSFKDLIRNYEADFKKGVITLPEQDFKGGMADMMGAGMNMSEGELGEEEKGMMDMMIGDAGVVTKLHLPGKVISCDDPKAIIEGKTVTIKDLYSELMENKRMKARSVKFETN